MVLKLQEQLSSLQLATSRPSQEPHPSPPAPQEQPDPPGQGAAPRQPGGGKLAQQLEFDESSEHRESSEGVRRGSRERERIVELATRVEDLTFQINSLTEELERASERAETAEVSSTEYSILY